MGFPTEADVENYAGLIGEQVTGPFCVAANRASRRAALYVTLNSAFARQYDCELQRWGEPHVEVLAHLGAQHPGRGLQRLSG